MEAILMAVFTLVMNIVYVHVLEGRKYCAPLSGPAEFWVMSIAIPLLWSFIVFVIWAIGNPTTTLAWVGFTVFCLLMAAFNILSVLSMKDYIINPDKIYDFKFECYSKNSNGDTVCLGYIDNGIAQSFVIIDDCARVCEGEEIKVRYNGNAYKEPVRVGIYDEKMQKLVIRKFDIHVRKVFV